MIVLLAIWRSNFFRIENLEDLPALERLGFRWNFIKTIENVSHLTALQVTTEQLRDQNRVCNMTDNSGVRAVRQPDQKIRKPLWLGQPQDARCVSQHLKEDRRAGGSCQVSISPVLFDLEVESRYSYSGSQTFKDTFFLVWRDSTWCRTRFQRLRTWTAAPSWTCWNLETTKSGRLVMQVLLNQSGRNTSTRHSTVNPIQSNETLLYSSFC